MSAVEKICIMYFLVVININALKWIVKQYHNLKQSNVLQCMLK